MGPAPNSHRTHGKGRAVPLLLSGWEETRKPRSRTAASHQKGQNHALKFQLSSLYG
jgi:hypothetical protein